MKSKWLTVHRYSSLTIVIFLCLSSLTGSVLVFYKEIDRVLNPQIFEVDKPDSGLVLMDPFGLYEVVQKQMPAYEFNRVRLDVNENENVKMTLRYVGESAELSKITEVYANPYTGKVVASRNINAVNLQNFMPVMFQFHRNLLMGKIGKTILGIVALIWTLNSFIGVYLTLPTKIKWATFFKVWGKKWRVRPYSNFLKWNIDLHKALGLWFWGFLLLMAWSSVSFNLPDFFTKVTEPFMTIEPYPSNLVAADLSQPALPMSTAFEAVKKVMDKEEKMYGFVTEQYRYLSLNERTKVFQVRARTSMDLNENGSTRIMLDATNGELLGRYYPTGQAAGNTYSSWLYALHMGTVGGTAYQLFLSAVGLVVFMLGFSGTYLWYRLKVAKRKK